MSFMTDLRRALRVLAHQPLFTSVAVLTLALGIGANVAVFSYFDAFLLARLPVPNADHVVRVYALTPTGDTNIVSYQVYSAVRHQAQGLDLAAYASTSTLLTDGDLTENRVTELVTGDYFRIAGLAPRLGRLLDARDDVAEGAHPVVVVAESLWRARFAADPAIVGHVVRLNGQPFTIVGVVPAPYRGTLGSNMADLWAPLMMQQVLRPRGLVLNTPGWGWLSMVGALAPGTSVDHENAVFSVLGPDLTRQLSLKVPLQLRADPATLLPERERRALTPYLQIVAVFTGLILLAAAANLAGVMQTRVIARRRDTAIRQSLGATRWRLAAEWLAECLVLAAAAGLVGMVIARAVVVALVTLKPPAQVIGNVSFDAPFDWRVLAVAAGAALVAGLLFGLASAWRAALVPPVTVLKEELTAGGGRGSRWRRVAVTVQVGVSAVLLLVATLLTTGLVRAQTLTPGFETDHLAMVAFHLPPAALAPGAGAFMPSLVAAIRALPGVTSADVTRSVPLEPGQDSLGFRIPGHVERDGTATDIDDAVVGAGYFDALGIPFLRGKTWDAAAEGRRDQVGSVVINETMARLYWAGRDPVGTTMIFENRGPVTVTGIVRDTAYYAVGEAPIPFVFVPAESIRPNGFTLMVRTSMNVEAMLPTLTRAANAVDPAIVAANAFSFVSMRGAFLAPQRLPGHRRGRLRRAGAAPDRRRPLWRRVSRRGATHAGDRGADGARRPQVAGARGRAQGFARARRIRHGLGARRWLCPGWHAPGLDRRRRPARSASLWARGGRARTCCGARRRLAAGPAGGERRSGEGATHLGAEMFDAGADRSGIAATLPSRIEKDVGGGRPPATGSAAALAGSPECLARRGPRAPAPASSPGGP